MYPKIEINLEGIRKNTEAVVRKCADFDIRVTGITKSFLADPEIAEAMIRGGVSSLGDSRVENLKRLDCFNIEKWLIRIPMESEIYDVVRYADVSLNSEMKTVRMLDREAGTRGKVHKVVLMADLGDLREGYFDVSELVLAAKETMDLQNVELYGIGTNLTCYGGIIPTEENLERLKDIALEVERECKTDLKVISGGNSSSYTLVDAGIIPSGISNLRIGEAIVLGRETSYGRLLEDLRHDNFIIKAQIIEIKDKPSYPVGTIGMDSFGNVPEFEDRGIRTRALVALGKQDVLADDLAPVDGNITVLGASSDHMILDVTDCAGKYELGDEVAFVPAYGALLSAMTGQYVKKEIIQER